MASIVNGTSKKIVCTDPKKRNNWISSYGKTRLIIKLAIKLYYIRFPTIVKRNR